MLVKSKNVHVINYVLTDSTKSNIDFFKVTPPQGHIINYILYHIVYVDWACLR